MNELSAPFAVKGTIDEDAFVTCENMNCSQHYIQMMVLSVIALMFVKISKPLKPKGIGLISAALFARL